MSLGVVETTTYHIREGHNAEATRMGGEELPRTIHTNAHRRPMV